VSNRKAAAGRQARATDSGADTPPPPIRAAKLPTCPHLPSASRPAARQGEHLHLAITRDGEHPLGEVLLKADGEIGYSIGARHRGQGLATRALVILRDHAHGSGGLALLRLRIDPGNAASVAVATQAGFRRSESAPETVEDKGRAYTVELWEHSV
jgi:hypothetical protein